MVEYKRIDNVRMSYNEKVNHSVHDYIRIVEELKEVSITTIFRLAFTAEALKSLVQNKEKSTYLKQTFRSIFASVYFLSSAFVVKS